MDLLINVDGTFKSSNVFEEADKLINEIVKLGKTNSLDVINLHLFEAYCEKSMNEKFDIERRKSSTAKRRKE